MDTQANESEQPPATPQALIGLLDRTFPQPPNHLIAGSLGSIRQQMEVARLLGKREIIDWMKAKYRIT